MALPPRSARSPAPLLSDLLGQLLLARVLRAGPAAFRLERLAAGLVAAVLIGSAAVAVPPLLGSPGYFAALGAFADAGLRSAAAPADLPYAARLLLVDAPAGLIAEAPATTAALTVAVILVLATCGLFVCRGAAVELGREVHLRIRRGLAFLRLKSPAAVLAFLLPLAVVALLLVTPLLLGFLLMVPGLDAVAGLLYGLALLAGVAAVVVLLAGLAASLLLLPAVACDGADAFDAVQRAFAIVLGRPLTLLLHASVAVVQGLALTLLVWVVLDLGATLAASVAGLPSPRSAGIIGAAGWTGPGVPSLPVAAVALWMRLPVVLAAAFAFSYANTAAVAVYLNLRLIMDGQEANELWMPDDPAGTSAVPGDHQRQDAPAPPAVSDPPRSVQDPEPAEHPGADPAAPPPSDAQGSPPPRGSREGQPA
jgi:hypothetical protein